MDIDPAAVEYCQTLVRTYDPDRYLLSLFYPRSIRAALWALYAFNYEVAKTREVVTDTYMGHIRLQWWRDALSSWYQKGETQPQQVMSALAHAISTYNLPRDLFENLLYAREFDLEDRQPGSLQGLFNYADYTNTPLLRLGLLATGETAPDDRVQAVATAYAVAGLLRSVPFHLQQGRCYLPEDMMRRNDINVGSAQFSKNRSALVPVTSAVRKKAQALLRAGTGPRPGKLVRLHQVIADRHLKKLARLGDNVYDQRLGFPPLFRIPALWAAGRR